MTHFTEDEILKIPKPGVTRGSKVNSAPTELFYPKQKRKEKAILSDAEEEFSWPNLINGYLQAIVYSLNKGRDIKVNSVEHRRLRELLEKANNFAEDVVKY